ncbi:glycosyltransferase family 1 protein [Stipitochalara longipes BDJ]|nr:glycosyltransferase family 1 protein [Stipitochalara longipes BDJ]
MEESSKPVLIFCATPVEGHFGPLSAIAKNMVVRGFEVIFITGSTFQSKIEKMGATFSPLLGKADFSMATVNSLFPGHDKAPPPSGPHRLVHSLLYVFVKQIPDQHETIQAVLHGIKKTRPQRKLILLVDFSFAGALPSLYGAPGLKPDGVIFLGIAPLFLSAPHIPPGGLGLPYDTSPAGLERNKEQYKYRDEELFSEVNSHVRTIFKDLGAEEKPDFILEMPILRADRFLQMCIPSLEYPHPNPPPGLRFVGSLPAGHRHTGKGNPVWWDDVAVNAPKKKIVAVSQGTANVTFSKLIIPTIEALANAKDVLVVVALGREGAVLPEGTVVPANVRVADYIPFDDLLPYTDVFVTNGGYGGYQHCMRHGVPMVIAGMAADKPEVANRAEWAGVGLNLKTDEPTVQAIKESVEKILGDKKYKKRAQELQKVMEGYDTFTLIAKNIEELAEAQTEG